MQIDQKIGINQKNMQIELDNAIWLGEDRIYKELL